jgi:hypothetical protein
VYLLSNDGPHDADDYRIKQFALKWQEILNKELVIKSLYYSRPKDIDRMSIRGAYTDHDGRKDQATEIVTFCNRTIYEERYWSPEGPSPHKNFNGVSKTVCFWPSTIDPESRTSTRPKEANGKRQTDYSDAKLVSSLQQVPVEAAARTIRVLSSALSNANIAREGTIESYEQARDQFLLAVNDVTTEQFDTVRRGLHLALNEVRQERDMATRLRKSSNVTDLATTENSIQEWLQGTQFAMFSKMLKDLKRERILRKRSGEQKAYSASASLAMISVNGSPEFFQTDTTYPGIPAGMRAEDFVAVSNASGLPIAEFMRSRSDAEVMTMGNIEKKLEQLSRKRENGKPYKIIEINILSVQGPCDGCDHRLKTLAQKWENKRLCDKLIIKLYYDSPPAEREYYEHNANEVSHTMHYGREEEATSIKTIRGGGDRIYEEFYAPIADSSKDYTNISGKRELWPTVKGAEKGDSASYPLTTAMQEVSIEQPRDARIADTVLVRIQLGTSEWLNNNCEFTQKSINTFSQQGGMPTKITKLFADNIISEAQSPKNRSSVERAILEHTGVGNYRQYIGEYFQCLTRKRDGNETLWTQYALEWLDHDGQFPQAIKDSFKRIGGWPRRYTDEIRDEILSKVKKMSKDALSDAPSKDKLVKIEDSIFDRLEMKKPEDPKEQRSLLREYVERSIKEITRG